MIGRNNPSIAIVISLAALVILNVFAGGVFIPFDKVDTETSSFLGLANTSPPAVVRL